MKKLFSFLLALIMVGSCFAFQLPEADAIGTVWVKEFIKDKFGDITDECATENARTASHISCSPYGFSLLRMIKS